MKPKYIGKDNLGEALHTALRKCCDSKPTTAAYLLVAMLPDDLWREYVVIVGQYFGAALAEKKLTPENADEHLKYASLGAGFGTAKEQKQRGFLPAGPRATSYDGMRGFFWVNEHNLDHKSPGALRRFIEGLPAFQTFGRTDDQILRERDRMRALFATVLATFDDGDWKGMASYVFSGAA